MKNVVAVSVFRATTFENNFGMLITDGPMAGLLARGVVIVDKEGKATDSMKVMGLDTKKTTLPKEVTVKLNNFIEQYLKGTSWENVSQSIVDYKDELKATTNPMIIGLPKGVQKIEEYTKIYNEQGMQARLPGDRKSVV